VAQEGVDEGVQMHSGTDGDGSSIDLDMIESGEIEDDATGVLCGVAIGTAVASRQDPSFGRGSDDLDDVVRIVDEDGLERGPVQLGVKAGKLCVALVLEKVGIRGFVRFRLRM
jgi:hypothetical protein